jgi:uncharacterized protein (TIGR03067 family)
MNIRWTALALCLILPALRAEDAEKEQDRLQGVWRVKAAAEGDAETIFGGELQDAVLIFNKAELILVTNHGKIHKGAFSVKAAEKGLSAIDFTWAGKVVQGVYAVKKAGVVLCFDRSGRERPAGLLVGGDRPSLALVHIEKQAGADVGLSDRETKWARDLANDYLAAFLVKGWQTYHRMMNQEVWGLPSPEAKSFDAMKLIETGLPHAELKGGVYAYTMVQSTEYRFTSFAIDTGTVSPRGEEVVFRGILSGKIPATYTLRVSKESKSGRWAIGSFDWYFVKEKK